jgi:hypothetical protein
MHTARRRVAEVQKSVRPGVPCATIRRRPLPGELQIQVEPPLRAYVRRLALKADAEQRCLQSLTSSDQARADIRSDAEVAMHRPLRLEARQAVRVTPNSSPTSAATPYGKPISHGESRSTDELAALSLMTFW